VAAIGLAGGRAAPPAADDVSPRPPTTLDLTVDAPEPPLAVDVMPEAAEGRRGTASNLGPAATALATPQLPPVPSHARPHPRTVAMVVEAEPPPAPAVAPVASLGPAMEIAVAEPTPGPTLTLALAPPPAPAEGAGDGAAIGGGRAGEGTGPGGGDDGDGLGGLADSSGGELHARIVGDVNEEVIQRRADITFIPDMEATTLRLRDLFPRLPEAWWGQHGPYLVVLDVCVATDGHVSDAELRSSASPKLDPIVLRAVKRWRYGPRLVGGKASPFCHRVVIKYERW
jgi:hypothetical protein